MFPEFIADLSAHVRDVERRAHGRTHPQTVSLFGPELWWRPNLPLEAPIFRHPDLDFATIHIYREGTIDDPRNTVAPATPFFFAASTSASYRGILFDLSSSPIKMRNSFESLSSCMARWI